MQLRVNTSVREGLILWACEEELGPHGDFFSIGVHEGFLQVFLCLCFCVCVCVCVFVCV